MTARGVRAISWEDGLRGVTIGRMSTPLQARPKSLRRNRLVKAAVAVAAVLGLTLFLSQVALVREGVITLLGKTGPWATPVICRGLDDEDVKVRQAAAEAL